MVEWSETVMKHLLILLLILLFTSPLFGQSERPETIVIPVGTLGDISDSRKQIIQNTLSQELTKYFRLVPQDKFEAALEKAFEELEYEECTEDQCIMMIQELLQVENVFSLQLVEEDGDTQLSLTWVGLDEDRVRIEKIKEQIDENEELRIVMEADNTDSNKRDMFNRTFENLLTGLVGENLDFYNKLKEPKKNRFMKDRMYELYSKDIGRGENVSPP